MRPVGLAIRTGRSVWRAHRGNERKAGVHTCAIYRPLDPTDALCIDCDAHATSEQAHGRGDDDDDHLRVSDYMTETLLAVAATMRARDPRSELNQARVRETSHAAPSESGSSARSVVSTATRSR